MSPEPSLSEGIAARVAATLEGRTRPLLIGLCGAQGIGKTTLARAIADRLDDRGITAITVSLDDFYLSRATRQRLARDVHPLFATRGVPGTHDVAAARAFFAALDEGRAAALPRFDKARDEPVPRADWPLVEAPRVILFEGWCVGAHPQPPAALAQPVNALERDEDADGRWRRYANEALASPYQALFGRIDRLILLAAPDFAVVRRWRSEQEADLQARTPDGLQLMDAAAIGRFVAHYERLTRHILAEMPGRADLLIELDEDRRPIAIVDRWPTGSGEEISPWPGPT